MIILATLSKVKAQSKRVPHVFIYFQAEKVCGER